MHKNRFDLTNNAFYILKADPSSSRSDIAEMVDDAEFDQEFSPDEIQRAQHHLLGPVTRLQEELSWLPELSAPQIASIVKLVSAGDQAGLLTAAEHLPEVAKVNLIGHIVGAGHVNTPICMKMLEAWSEIDKLSILNNLNDKRQKAGFPSVELVQLNTAMTDLEKRHAENLALAVWCLEHPGKAMEEIVETVLAKSIADPIFEKFVRSYDRQSEPDLARIREQIDICVEDIMSEDGNLNAMIGVITGLLAKWDDINQAVQVFEQHHGHEEARSKQIYEQLRQLCLFLANERNEYSAVRRLETALLRTFPELESVAEVLRDDLLQLEALDEQQKEQRLLEPLVAACSLAKDNPTEISGELRRNGFSASALGLLSNVFKTFETAVTSLSDVDMAYYNVRGLALSLNNEQDDAEAAFRLINGILNFGNAKPSSELIEKLEEERSIVHRTWKMKDLEKNKGNISAMSRIVDEMFKYAKKSDRNELFQLKNKLEHVRNQVEKKKNERLGWWIGLGVIVILVIAYGG